ncbi:MAG: SIMPL domain-containing protein, partial [Pseudorhodoplanes sp.]
AATQLHRERADKGAAMLKSLALEGLSIEGSTFRLDQASRPTPPGQKPVSEYRAVTSFSLKVKPLDKIDDVITKIAASGLFELNNLRFALDDNTKALDAARQNAVEDARRRANIYAQAAGVEVGEAIEISDTDRRYPIPARPMALPRETNVQVVPPESLDVHAAVTVTWRIKEKQ